MIVLVLNQTPQTYSSRTSGATGPTAYPWALSANTPASKTTFPTPGLRRHAPQRPERRSSQAWAGPNVGFGKIDNVTYKDLRVENTDAPIVLDQCYFNINETTCAKYPSQVNITNVKFINVYGTSSGKAGNVVADLKCSPGAKCEGIHLENINITSPKGEAPVIVCENIKGDIGVDCVSSSNSTSAK
jgi:hypothetical protein